MQEDWEFRTSLSNIAREYLKTQKQNKTKREGEGSRHCSTVPNSKVWEGEDDTTHNRLSTTSGYTHRVCTQLPPQLISHDKHCNSWDVHHVSLQFPPHLSSLSSQPLKGCLSSLSITLFVFTLCSYHITFSQGRQHLPCSQCHWTRSLSWQQQKSLSFFFFFVSLNLLTSGAMSSPPSFLGLCQSFLQILFCFLTLICSHAQVQTFPPNPDSPWNRSQAHSFEGLLTTSTVPPEPLMSRFATSSPLSTLNHLKLNLF